MAEYTKAGTQNVRFLLLYALAVAGGAAAYVPFLTIILPLRITDLAGPQDVQWLSYATFAGATAASSAGILFGWLSDRVRQRRIWIWCGLIASSVVLLAFSKVETFTGLIVFILLWQIALNMIITPLAAWAGDCVPDHQKGMLGGLLAFGPAFGALSGAIITLPDLAAMEGRLWAIVCIVGACILPVLLFGRPRRFVELEAPACPVATPVPLVRMSREVVLRMWSARLLVQVCEAALFAYVLFWFRSVDSDLGDDGTAQILFIVVVMAIPVALLIGRWADRNNRPINPLAACAAVASLGLGAMALSANPPLAIAAYAIFGVASAAFLSLHSSQTLRVLPKPERRGRDLGIFNLTNTAPSLVMPWLVIILVPAFGFQGLFAILAVLAFLASLLLWNIDQKV